VFQSKHSGNLGQRNTLYKSQHIPVVLGFLTYLFIKF
jgi:hypothetical protein